MRDWLACARRDLLIVVQGVWKNVAAYLGMLAIAAVILDICRCFHQAGFLQLLLNSFHMSHFMRVPEAETAAASSILAFLLPICTIIIVGEGALRVAVVYLQRRQRREEWEPMVIGTFSGHTIVCGVGELGRSICERLLEKDPQAQLVLADLRQNLKMEYGFQGYPNVEQVPGDMTNIATLEAAGCKKAARIIIASGNDGLNLETAFKVLHLTPQAQIAVRLYRRGLSSLFEEMTPENVRFFWPYERAAESLME